MKRTYQSLITNYAVKSQDLDSAFVSLSLQKRRKERHASSIVFDRFHSCIPIIETELGENVIYMHPHLRVVYIPNQDRYGVYSEGDILPGEVLAFERAVVDTRANLETYLERHPEIAKQLYPRNLESRVHELTYKIDYNVWDWYDKSEDDPKELRKCVALFNLMSKFNHDCNPNAFVVREVLNTDMDNYDGYFSLMCVRPISAGEEICLSYGMDAGHENRHFNWPCYCWRDEETRKELFEEALQRATEDWKQVSKYFLSQWF